MKFISLDLEFSPESQKIIEIGAQTWDTDVGQPTGTFEVHVDQTIKWDYVMRDGRRFEDWLPTERNVYETGVSPVTAFIMFWDWVKAQQSSYRFVQWGSGDMKLLLEQSHELNVKYPIRIQTIDCKLIYKNLYQPASRLPKKYGQWEAAVACGYPSNPAPVQHVAKNDAFLCGYVYNTMFQAFKNFADVLKITDKQREILGGVSEGG